VRRAALSCFVPLCSQQQVQRHTTAVPRLRGAGASGSRLAPHCCISIQQREYSCTAGDRPQEGQWPLAATPKNTRGERMRCIERGETSPDEPRGQHTRSPPTLGSGHAPATSARTSGGSSPTGCRCATATPMPAKSGWSAVCRRPDVLRGLSTTSRGARRSHRASSTRHSVESSWGAGGAPGSAGRDSGGRPLSVTPDSTGRMRHGHIPPFSSRNCPG